MDFWNSVYKELFASFGMQSRVVSLSKNCSMGIWMSLEQMLICEMKSTLFTLLVPPDKLLCGIWNERGGET